MSVRVSGLKGSFAKVHERCDKDYEGVHGKKAKIASYDLGLPVHFDLVSRGCSCARSEMVSDSYIS